MNILYLNLYDDFGGAEKICNALYDKALPQDNHYRFVLAGNRNRGSDKTSYSLFSKYVFENLEEYLIRYDFLKKNVRIMALCCIVWLIWIHRIDVVHLHNTHDYLISVKGVRFLLKFVPVVWTMHDMWPMTGHCAYASKCVGWKDDCKRCDNLSVYPAIADDCAGKFFLQKKALYNEARLYRVCPSKWLYNMVVESKIGKKNLLYIPNGVDTGIFRRIDKKLARKKRGLDENKKYLLFVAASADNKRKGMRYLIDAVRTLKDIKGLELLIIGDMKHKALGCDIPVHRFGYISDGKVLNELYAAADLFINPSVEENFPCTNLEAMASGTPVVAFRTGGIAEQLDETSGFMADEISAKALAAVIRTALTDEDKLNHISESAYRNCVNLFSLNSMRDHYRRLYAASKRKHGAYR